MFRMPFMFRIYVPFRMQFPICFKKNIFYSPDAIYVSKKNIYSPDAIYALE